MKKIVGFAILMLVLEISSIKNINAYMLRTKDCSYTNTQTLVTQISNVSKPYRLLYYSTSSYTSAISNADEV